MRARDAYRCVKEQLSKAGVDDAGFDAEALLQHTTDLDRFSLDEVGEQELAALQSLAKRRAAREPLQYLLGRWPFLDLELAVGPGVLIPRPETEEVCLAAAGLFAPDAAPAVLDLCAGTGALALGLQSLLPAAAVFAVEKEPEAFGYLDKNLREYEAKGSRTPQAVQGDVLAPGMVQALKNKVSAASGVSGFDLIVSNPPYVTEVEYAALEPELRFEPRAALVAEEDGLAFYRVIARDYLAGLQPGGWMVFETGSSQGKPVARLLERHGYTSIEVRQDMAGQDRIVLGQRPE